MKKLTPRSISVVVALLVGAAILWFFFPFTDAPHSTIEPPERQNVNNGTPTPGVIENAFNARASDINVTGRGTIIKILPDDLEGSRHQRFIVKLASGHTVLIAHNIDLAPRVPDLQSGQPIRFRGDYEWNEKGGLIHWTHHDPKGWHPGGWLEYDGQKYQ